MKQNVGYEDLSNILSEVLELPRLGRQGEAYRTVKAIFRVISDALLRGEEVAIAGLGILRVKELPARKRYFSTYYGGSPKPLGGYIDYLPAKKHVVFDPSKVLLRLINGTQS